MKFGLGPFRLGAVDGSHGQAHEEMVAQALHAQENAFDSVWVQEAHFTPGGWCPAPFVPAAALAVRVDALRIGVLCSLGLTHPVYTAEDAATLDNISNGRVILAVAKPVRQEEWSGYAVRPEDGVGRFWESVEVLQHAWAPGPFSFDGQHYRIPARLPENQFTHGQSQVSLTPKPAQLSIPLWVAATDENAIEGAAQRGLPIVGLAHDDFAQLREKLSLYRKYRGRPCATDIFAVIRHVYVADSDKQAREEAHPALEKLYAEYRELAFPTQEGGPASETGLLGQAITGSVETCIEQLYRYRDELGISYVICDMALPGLAQEKVLRAIELFGKAVISEFRMVNFPKEIRDRFLRRAYR